MTVYCTPRRPASLVIGYPFSTHGTRVSQDQSRSNLPADVELLAQEAETVDEITGRNGEGEVPHPRANAVYGFRRSIDVIRINLSSVSIRSGSISIRSQRNELSNLC